MDKQLILDIEQQLREMGLLMKRKEREILHRFPITQQQFFVLLLLTEYGNMTIGELSQKCCLACSTMTDLIDRMEKNQVVKRIRGERDRRIVNIHLLPTGKELICRVMEARQQYLSKVLSHLSTEEGITIKKQLSSVYKKMKEL